MPLPLRLEGEAEKAAGSTTADAFPAADAFPLDPQEVGLSCEVGVTCAVGAARSRFAVEDKASEYAVCWAIDTDDVVTAFEDGVGRAAADALNISETLDVENEDGAGCGAIGGTNATLEDVAAL